MRYLILSDLHAGLEALEACVSLANGKYDQAVCLGDLVGYGPDPAAVIDNIRALTQQIIRGNHDKACSGLTDAEDFNAWARLATYWTRSALSEDRLSFLRELKAGPLNVNGFEMVHGSASDEDQYVLRVSDATPLLRLQPSPVAFFGHSHIQGGFLLDTDGEVSPIGISSSSNSNGRPEGCVAVVTVEPGARYLVNPGSVGQPRDGDWRSAFAIFDDHALRIEYYRTDYNLPLTQKKMTQAHLPDPLIRRLEIGR